MMYKNFGNRRYKDSRIGEEYCALSFNSFYSGISLIKIMILLFMITYFFLAEIFANDFYISFGNKADTEQKICLKAKYDVKTYHGKGESYFIFGFFTGPIAVIYSLLNNENLSEKTKVLSNNKDLFTNQVYISCYTKTANKNLLVSTLFGWLCSSFFIFIIVMIYKHLM